MPKMYKKKAPLRRRPYGGRRRRNPIPYPRSMGTALRHKTYNYNFALDPQFLIEDVATGGITMKISGGSAPVFSATLPSASASISGLTNAYDQGFAAQFRLTDIQNFLQFSSMYDQFKINSVSCVITILTGQNADFLPTLYSIIDEDSATPPTAATDITGMQGFKRMQFQNGSKNSFRVSCRPKYVQTVQGGFAVMARNYWQDCATATASPGNALKFWLENVPLGLVGVSTCFKLQWYYNVSFRQPILLH